MEGIYSIVWTGIKLWPRSIGRSEESYQSSDEGMCMLIEFNHNSHTQCGDDDDDDDYDDDDDDNDDKWRPKKKKTTFSKNIHFSLIHENNKRKL